MRGKRRVLRMESAVKMVAALKLPPAAAYTSRVTTATTMGAVNMMVEVMAVWMAASFTARSSRSRMAPIFAPKKDSQAYSLRARMPCSTSFMTLTRWSFSFTMLRRMAAERFMAQKFTGIRMIMVAKPARQEG